MTDIDSLTNVSEISGFNTVFSLPPVLLGHTQPLAKSCSAGRCLIILSLLVCNLDQIGIWDYGYCARVWQASALTLVIPELASDWISSGAPLLLRICRDEVLSEEVDFRAVICYSLFILAVCHAER